MILFGMCVAFVVLFREYFSVYIAWLSTLSGWQGPLLYCLMFILISLPCMWGYLVLNLGAGYIYGFWEGAVLTVCGTWVGCIVSFLVCRHVLKSPVDVAVAKYKQFSNLLRVTEGSSGFKIMAMIRLTPIPLGVQNALLSVCSSMT